MKSLRVASLIQLVTTIVALVLLSLCLFTSTAKAGDDCSDFNKCWDQAIPLCPPNVTVPVFVSGLCNDRLTQCQSYVAACNKEKDVNIVVDYSWTEPPAVVCSDQLSKCVRAIGVNCNIRPIDSKVQFAAGGTLCSRAYGCFGDAKFCFCNSTDPKCEFKLGFSMNSGSSVNPSMQILIMIGLVVASVWYVLM